LPPIRPKPIIPSCIFLLFAFFRAQRGSPFF
jgi:hypothetical protein